VPAKLRLFAFPCTRDRSIQSLDQCLCPDTPRLIDCWDLASKRAHFWLEMRFRETNAAHYPHRWSKVKQKEDLFRKQNNLSPSPFQGFSGCLRLYMTQDRPHLQSLGETVYA
jgi:hypothetical protein